MAIMSSIIFKKEALKASRGIEAKRAKKNYLGLVFKTLNNC